jgi:hypothetical protein
MVLRFKNDVPRGGSEMSYEGYYEYLCVKGHHFEHDAYEARPGKCEFYGAPLAYWHSVDETNGYDETLPGPVPAPKEEISFDAVPYEDHHGNKYYSRQPRYRPLKEWREYVPPKAGGSSCSSPS